MSQLMPSLPTSENFTIRASFCCVSHQDAGYEFGTIFVFIDFFTRTLVLTAATFYFAELLHQLIPITKR